MKIPVDAGKAWRLGLAAVIEEKVGGPSYWALAHRRGKPDFHDPRSFASQIAVKRLMKFGIDRLITEPELRAPLEGSAWRCWRTPPRSPPT